MRFCPFLSALLCVFFVLVCVVFVCLYIHYTPWLGLKQEEEKGESEADREVRRIKRVRVGYVRVLIDRVRSK